MSPNDKGGERVPSEPLNDLQSFREKWTDALAAFGASIEVHRLPDGIENRESYKAFLDDSGVEERPVRVVVVGREYVTGPVLVELDANREKIVRALSYNGTMEVSGGQ